MNFSRILDYAQFLIGLGFVSVIFQLFFHITKHEHDIYLRAYIQSVPYHIGLSLRFKDKNKHIN